MSNDEIDVDAATVEVIRSNDAEIRRLSAELSRGGSDTTQRRLAADLVNATKRQEGALAEVPGMEDRARQLTATRAELEAYYDLGDEQDA